MKKPPLNVLIGFICATIGTFQPLLSVNTDKVVITNYPTYSLLVLASIAVLTGLYDRKKREYIAPALLLAVVPVFCRNATYNQIQDKFHVPNVEVSFAAGSLYAFVAAICILSAAFEKKEENSHS